jgi:hypothetical protein
MSISTGEAIARLTERKPVYVEVKGGERQRIIAASFSFTHWRLRTFERKNVTGTNREVVFFAHDEERT